MCEGRAIPMQRRNLGEKRILNANRDSLNDHLLKLLNFQKANNTHKMKRHHRIEQAAAFFLCLIAWNTRVTQGLYIKNPQFMTDQCIIDHTSHTCLVFDRQVPPWQTTRSDHKIELTTLEQFLKIFPQANVRGEERTLLLCVLWQFQSIVISQPLHLFDDGFYRLTFDAIGGDIRNLKAQTYMVMSISTGQIKLAKRILVPLDKALNKLTISFTLGSQSIFREAKFQFYLIEQRSGVVVAFTNWLLELFSTNKILNGQFKIPELGEGQRRRFVSKSQVQHWKIISYGYIVQWQETQSYYQGFMFQPKLGLVRKISQEFVVESSGMLKISFLFKYECSPISKGVLLVKIRDQEQFRIILDPKKKIFNPYKVYNYQKKVKCRKGNYKIALIAQASSFHQILIYFSAVKVQYYPRQMTETEQDTGFSYTSPQRQGGVSSSGAYFSPPPKNDSLPEISHGDFILNGRFAWPHIPNNQSVLRVLDKDIPFWNIIGLGRLKRYSYLQNTQAFLFVITKEEPIQLTQAFQVRERIEGQISFFYKLDTQSDSDSTLNVLLNDVIVSKIFPRALREEQMYQFVQRHPLKKQRNTLSFQAETLSAQISGIIILDVKVTEIEQTQADSQEGDSNQQFEAVGGQLQSQDSKRGRLRR